MANDKSPRQRLRITFARGELLKYISHLDLARAWERAFRRARLPLAYSQGFNPRPRFQIAAGLPVGVAGQAELLDVWLTEVLAPDDLLCRLRPVLPPGLEALAAEEVDLHASSLQSQLRAADYQVVVYTQEPLEIIQDRLKRLLDAPTLPRRRQHKGKWQTYDLRPLIYDAIVEPGGEGCQVLHLRLQASPHGAGRPDEVIDALGLSPVVHTITRTNLHFEFDK